MTQEVAAILRRQFPPEQIGKLPRQGIQLDYVGHADVTSRLIEADPTWSWEPLALDEQGLPVYELAGNGAPVGFWIKLTVAGVTRLGYGSVPDNQRDAVKVLIGDALRNAAMRFGVAVDLWAKGDRQDPTVENPSGSAGHVARSGGNVRNLPPRPNPPKGAMGHIDENGEKVDLDGLVKSIKESKNLDELRKVWTDAGNGGFLNQKLPKQGGITVTEFLYERSEELNPKSGNGAGNIDPKGSGDAAQKLAGKGVSK